MVEFTGFGVVEAEGFHGGETGGGFAEVEGIGDEAHGAPCADAVGGGFFGDGGAAVVGEAFEDIVRGSGDPIRGFGEGEFAHGGDTGGDRGWVWRWFSGFEGGGEFFAEFAIFAVEVSDLGFEAGGLALDEGVGFDGDGGGVFRG